MKFIEHFGYQLIKELNNPDWNRFVAGIAFVKSSGVKHIAGALSEFGRRGQVKLVVGIDHHITSVQGLQALLDVTQNGQVWVFHDPARTFHPKGYLFSNRTAAAVCIGSVNLTNGGLFTNYEWSSHSCLNLNMTDDRIFADKLEDQVDWYIGSGNCFRLDKDLIDRLDQDGYVVDERKAREAYGNRQTSDLFRPIRAPFGFRTGEFVYEAAAHGQFASVGAYSKRLTRSDAQRKPDGHASGGIALVKAGNPICPQTYFRHDLFRDAVWESGTIRGKPKETAMIPCSVDFLGEPLGVVPVKVTHATHRESDQSNFTSFLHWGALSEYVSGQDLTDKMLHLERRGGYRMSIR